MAKWYALIHSAASKMPRRLIASDSAPIDVQAHIGLGEDGFTINQSDLIKGDDGVVEPSHMRAMIGRHYNVDVASLPDDYCAVVTPSGDVLDMIHADQDIDLHHEGKVISAPRHIRVKDKYLDGGFLTRFAVTQEGVVTGHIWDTAIDPALSGLVVDGVMEIGDTLPPLTNVDSSNTRKL